MNLAPGIGHFFNALWDVLPAILPRLAGAWLATFVVLIYAFRWLKAHVRPALLRLDDRIRFWALGFRYGVRGDAATERKALTWFFRFWTNFASAPSLIFFSFAVPMAFYVWAWPAPGQTSPPESFPFGNPSSVPGQLEVLFLPGFCYAGSMLMSFVSKRVFKRVRPQRDVGGAFGHKLKDGSFPSGHSLTSFCFWAMLAAAVIPLGIPLAAVLGLAGFLIVAMTGLSRIYLGVHFPSDVFGGYTIGAIWSAVCLLALRSVLG